jgi:hypothetical protein
MMVKSSKSIPVRNYFIVSGILVVSIFLVYYLYLWYQTYEEDRLNTPIMDNYLSVINYNELSSYIWENGSAVVYVSVLGDEDIRSFENKFKNTIVSYSLKNDILYMDLTSEFESDSYSSELFNNYSLDRSSVPTILVFEDGKLIDSYDIVSHNYSIKKVKKYLVSVGVIDND